MWKVRVLKNTDESLLTDMASQENIKAAKVDSWEEYAVIEFCEKGEEKVCEGTEEKTAITFTENFDNVYDHENIMEKHGNTLGDHLTNIMEQTDGNFGTGEGGGPGECRTCSYTASNAMRSHPYEHHETTRRKEACNTGYQEFGTTSENHPSMDTDDEKRVGADRVFVPEGKAPPKMPGVSRPFCEKLQFIETGICWIRHELNGLREADRELIKTFRELISQSRRLKRVNDAFLEQQEILEEIDDLLEKEEFENLHLIDTPLPSDVRMGMQRRVSNIDRYIRIGRVCRRASHY